MAAAPKTAQDILVKELKEIYSAERQLSRAVPKLVKKIGSEPLRAKLDERREQGARLVEELDNVFEEMDVTRARPKNVAVEGLIEDINLHVEEIQEPTLLDSELLAAVQKVEHYCIAAWGTSASLGRLLGEQQTVQVMERALEEGKRFDQDLTDLAEKEINPAMLASGERQGTRSGRERQQV
ncbi:hypothetical protein CLG96_05395 [Sphingomonas oleivorans]|uniref:Uncharacterized protein n=1 Tax=Sphingomonas oleivorans TaxID=1735121 RepID=A0A2T5FZ92_9SPHN|nr:DUF892 family protein [Sphingomonas oleivorans]PTQ12016.1 hypothetical protein CLG96_05395 [Sphingomonas oleivorans]